ncbi:MAG: Fe-S cluster assembly protein SufD [Gammaproteobacteria bacterium]
MIFAVAEYREHFQQIQNSADPALNWLRAYREQQLAQFLAQGFPTRQQENWRYTDLSLLTRQSFALANANFSIDTQDIFSAYELKNTEHLRLVFINGYYQAALSQLTGLPIGVQLMPLSQALCICPQHILPYLKQEFPNEPLVNLNTAFMTDGLFLYLPNDCIIKQPIHLLFLSAAQQPMMQQIRNIVRVGDQAQVTLFEHHGSLTEINYWNNVVTQIHMSPGANLHYYKCQQESAAAIHSAQTNIHQQRDSQVFAWQGAFGAQLARENWQVNLAEQNAAVALHGWYGALEQQHLAQYIQVNHDAPDTTSSTFYKGLANDKATAVFNGRIVVQQTAQKTQAKLTNQNLLLAKTATINAKPELEIYADDVKCGHSATVGQLDEHALFYLQARGIDKMCAHQLLLQAFAENMLEPITSDAIKTFIGHLMQQKLCCSIGKERCTRNDEIES